MTGDRLLLLGGSGQLGRAILRAAPGRCVAPGRSLLDLRTAGPDDYQRLLVEVGPRAVLNAAAMADVDACTSDPAQASAVNARGPGLLAAACASGGVPLVHVSSDYVFGGPAAPAPCGVDATPCPVQEYGATKADGERRVLAAGGRAVVARVSWLFGEDPCAFERFVLAQAAAPSPARVAVARQRSRPTFAPDLAAWLLGLAALLGSGLPIPPILHPGGGPAASRARWARAILDACGRGDVDVIEQGDGEWEGLAVRPADSRLDTTCTLAWSDSAGLPRIRDWRDAVPQAGAARARGHVVVPAVVG